MPKKSNVGREEILSAAAEVVRKRGERELNARAIAKELGCSTQPVYSYFRGMEELKSALFETAKARYHAHIEEYIRLSGRSRYESYGMGFVRFAREERGLFQFLFLSGEHGPVADPYFKEIIAEMMALYHMSEETARAFHTDMSVYSFGLAAGAGQDVTDEEISAAFKREFYALYAYYFPERPRLGGN